MQHQVGNYLNNAVEMAKTFGRNAVTELNQNLYKTRYGYASRSGPVAEAAQFSNAPSFIAGALGADIATDATRRVGWKWTNAPRMAGEMGRQLSKAAGMDPVTGAVLTAATPAILMSLSGQLGSPLAGLRPKGYKAVAPASKEEDPSGRTPVSIPAEAALRYIGTQRSQILPYEEFKKERPEVMPSTYRAYRRYEYAKSKPGELVSIDPETQSFATVAGLVRGSARGLADPEIRVKGFPITASGVLGTAAGLGTAAAAYKALPRSGMELHSAAEKYTKLNQPETAAQIRSLIKPFDVEAVPVKVPGERTTYVPQLGTSLGVVAAGLGTAALVGAATKKLFAKAEQERVKKENPVEYLKYKHGDIATAAQALGKPQARSWQELTPYVK